jgi:DnaJ like chaperone protein
VWGKIIGGMAGFAMGGPLGAVVGAALGHAAETGGLGQFSGMQFQMPGLGPARMAARLGGKQQLFSIGVVVLSARLAKCDGPVNRLEIDGFKRHFRVPADSARDIGRLFDQARNSDEAFEPLARQMGEAFADNRLVLEDVLAALFAIARADRPVNGRETDFLQRVWHGFGLGQDSWERASGAAPRRAHDDGEDPYAVLGVPRDAAPEMLRATWKQLMRENHPDSLAGRGVPPEFIARAGDKVARINAAWDRIKRERGL